MRTSGQSPRRDGQSLIATSADFFFGVLSDSERRLALREKSSHETLTLGHPLYLDRNRVDALLEALEALRCGLIQLRRRNGNPGASFPDQTGKCKREREAHHDDRSNTDECHILWNIAGLIICSCRSPSQRSHRQLLACRGNIRLELHHALVENANPLF